AAPVMQDSTPWRATPIETSIFERGKLKEPGNEQDTGVPDPGSLAQPGAVLEELAPAGHRQIRNHTHRGPYQGISHDHQAEELQVLAPPGREPAKHLNQRQAGGQHHGHGHESPAGNEDAGLVQAGARNGRAMAMAMTAMTAMTAVAAR